MDSTEVVRQAVSVPEAPKAETPAEPKPKGRPKGSKTKAKAEAKVEARKATPKAPRNALYPFRAGCNADVAWKYVLKKLKHGKPINHEDVAKGFLQVDDGKGDMAPSRAANFLPWCHKHGMLTPVEGERGTYTLSPELNKLVKKEAKGKETASATV